MEEKTVTINEEPALDLKTFGSDFFNINKGINECMIYPENTYDTTVYWQDRYLQIGGEKVKNVGIHVLDFNDNIIDFISQSDGALINL